MESKWKKVKMALGYNLCVYVPTEESPPPQPERRSDAAFFSPPPEQWSAGGSAPRPASTILRLSKSLSRSSKKTCTICLGSMKRGEGQAIFTGECSHSFHFHCIASNVKHGNQICPVCRAEWKDVPLQGPTGFGRTRVNPVSLSLDDRVTTLIRRFPPRQAAAAPVFSGREPSVFDDDEALDRPTSDGNPPENPWVSVKTYAEVPAVARSSVSDDFTVLIHLKAPVSVNPGPASGHPNRAPVDLVTVLDISGSMAGTKLALLKRAMGFVIQNLGPADRLSVVAFSSTARRLFPLRRMSDAGKHQALQAVNSLAANGGTNVAEGLRKGVKVVDDRREKNPVSSIVLLSDGQDTYTVTSGSTQNHRMLVPTSTGGHSGAKIPVHAFGFGVDHDASLMHSISEASGGTFSFIETEGVIQDAFAQCIGGLLSVVVKGLRVIVESANPNVRLRSLKTGSYENHSTPDGKSGCVDVGDLYADEERDFLVSVNVPPETTSSRHTSLLSVRCVYTDPLTKETVDSGSVAPENVTIERPETLRGPAAVSIEVDRQRNRLRSAEAMVRARSAAEEGDLAGAVGALEEWRRLLAETASAKSGDRLCTALDAEMKEMQERMGNRRAYESTGRAYVLSGLSSHSWQRATARGDSTDGSSRVQSYQTPSMVEMLGRSQADVLGGGGRPKPR